MVALIVLIGVYPKPFLDRIEPAAERVVQTLNDASVLPGSATAEGP
jgi:NADH:ubiquinone oxidoreductase subunit 4 (subunit M)